MLPILVHNMTEEGVEWQKGQLNVVKIQYFFCYFLKSGKFSINGRNREKSTPLHLTSKLKIAKYLVNKGSDINATDDYGETPLHVACDMGWIKIVKFLVEKNADINVRCSRDESTPLIKAISEGIIYNQYHLTSYIIIIS